MKLPVRFNIAACLILAAGGLGVGVFTSQWLQAMARRDLVAQAHLMLDGAVAARTYTSAEIVPLLNAHMQNEFVPQSVPFYAATQNFLRLREQRPQYSYKEATLNPTNPRDRAMDWEADVIQRFRDNTKLAELAGERDTPQGRSIYVARPIFVVAECMECHGIAASAPKSLVSRYGANNGFGWAVNEVVGAQVVSVPATDADGDIHRSWIRIMWIIAAIFIGLLVALNVAFFFIVMRPINRFTAIASAVSTGHAAVEFPRQASGELADLSRAFERMRTSLEKAMKLLGS